MAALIKVGTDFIAPAPTSKVDDAVYAALDLEVATVVDHTPARDEDIPAAERETCRVLEDVHLLTGPARAIPRSSHAASWCISPATPKAGIGPTRNA
ncbi:hypothetical protein GCM10009647_052930 [Streptomyces sanglieri]|uniref:Uncharacterized protein n=1 Tax=Streptomyces sanglieri TaxID=193460 RepID=A0ABW2WNE4_9ACTN|nr:hypothetical protein [Streptomyces sp. Wh19]MDV9193905.1 hypothetical protein [Streptomyces sp. Wh19]